MNAGAETPKAWESGAAYLAVLLAILMSVLDWSVWHSGMNSYDEAANPAMLQLAREGTPLYLLAFKGSLYRHAFYLYSAIFGTSLATLHLCILSFFILENILLANYTRGLFGKRAACWALIINAACAFSMVRCRSLLSYSVVPAELLAFLIFLPRACRPWSAFIWALLAMLLIFDYEVWLLGAPMLLVFFLSRHRDFRARAWALLGAAAGLGILIYFSKASLEDHFRLRALSVSAPGASLPSALMGGLRSFWLGAFQYSFLGASGHPAFPPWALPGLFMGMLAALWRWKSGLTWVALAFIPMIAGGSAAEPQRGILAWPMLCVIGGLGFSRIVSFLNAAPARLILIVSLLLGSAVEARAFYATRDPYDIDTYGEWRQWIQAVHLAEHLSQGRIPILADLGRESGAGKRFFMKAPKSGVSSDQAMVLLDPGFSSAARKLGGRLIPVSISEKLPPASVWVVQGLAARRLIAAEKLLTPLWSRTFAMGPSRRREAAIEWLDANPGADPWARTLAWEALMNASAQLNDLPFERIKQALKEPLVGAYFYLELADRLMGASPSQSLALARAGLLRDPENTAGLRLQREALSRLNLASNGVR